MLIGRTAEIRRLEKIYQSKEAEFVVLYGRRRVGKTFLIRQFFEQKKGLFFQVTGLQKGSMQKQLEHFSETLSAKFTHGIPIKTPPTWEEAFKLLTQFIDTANPKNKTTLFLDELPWLATRRSGLLEALDYYWNHHWSTHPNIILVVCGSSASWLIKNIIYNKGGLHNRCTCELKLEPFNLSETYSYLSSKGITLNKRHVLELYMALGGIPYYLNYVSKGLSASANIQKILFDKNAPLKDEFKKLFDSLFVDAEAYVELIQLIAQRKEGVSRATLESQSKYSNGGGRLTARLKQLEQTNFIEAYLPWEKQKGEYYKVMDAFCLFYLYWLTGTQGKRITDNYWLRQIQKPIYQVWAGYAFETICYKNIDKIIHSLDIPSAEKISPWRYSTKEKKENGAQIDLLIDRDDDAITICEIKYTEKPFIITKQYAEILNKKITIFKEKTKTTKQIFLVLISANGAKQNQYYNALIHGLVTLEDLFTDI